jgi:hypothetical protein
MAYGRVTVVTNSDTEGWQAVATVVLLLSQTSDTDEGQAVATVVLLLSQTRKLRNDNQWPRSCYCYHKLGHWGRTSSGYGRVTVVTNSDTEEWQAVATIVLVLSQIWTLRNDKQWLRSCYCCHKLGHWGMARSGYGRITAVTNSDTEEWQAVATVVLLLSQTRILRNDKQWLRPCYCCHKLEHWGMTSSGYNRITFVTGVTNSDIEEWQAVATIVLLLSPVSQTRTLRNDKQWPRSCYFCHRCHQLGHWGMTSSGYGRVTVVTGVINSDITEWQAVATIVLVLSQTRTLRTDKQWLRLCYCCHKLGHWGMTSSGDGRVTVVTNSRTLRNDKQWLRSC